MRKFKRAGMALSAFALVAFMAAPALAQQAAQPKEKAAASSIEGELVNVDTDAKTLVVKPADGNEIEFKYNDKTEVSGATQGVAGVRRSTVRSSTIRVRLSHSAVQKLELNSKCKCRTANFELSNREPRTFTDRWPTPS